MFGKFMIVLIMLVLGFVLLWPIIGKWVRNGIKYLFTDENPFREENLLDLEFSSELDNEKLADLQERLQRRKAELETKQQTKRVLDELAQVNAEIEKTDGEIITRDIQNETIVARREVQTEIDRRQHE